MARGDPSRQAHDPTQGTCARPTPTGVCGGETTSARLGDGAGASPRWRGAARGSGSGCPAEGAQGDAFPGCPPRVTLGKGSLGAPCPAGGWDGLDREFIRLIHPSFSLWGLTLMDPEET